MIIGALNSTHSVKSNDSRVKNQNLISAKQNQTNSATNPTIETGNYGKVTIGLNKKFKPSFGFEPIILAYAALYIGTVAYACYKTSVDEKKRAEEQQKIEKEKQKNINKISDNLGIDYGDALKYHSEFLKMAEIPTTNDGNEKGLNAVRGYGVEKYKLAVDVIAPIVSRQKGGYDSSFGIPNGVVLYGPPGGGKTYISEKVCEHMEHFGINIENIILDPNDHDGNAQKITEAFSKGKERYKETKKQTVINFVQDMDNFLVDRNKKLDFVKETSALLYGADNCAKDGVIWMCTANNPRNIDPALLRPGRADVKLAIGNMEKFAVADMLKYSLFKYGEKNSAENFNFNKVVQEMEKNEDVFTPAELELFVREAIKKRTIPHEQITAEMVIAEIERYKQEDFITLDSETRKKFKEDQEYIKSEFSPPPPPPKEPVEIDYSKPYDAYDEEEDFK